MKSSPAQREALAVALQRARPGMLERVLARVAPTMALRRFEARTRFELAAQAAGKGLSRRGFDAADRGRRTKGWITPQTSANAETYGRLTLIRARCRDLVRNNCWASKAVRSIVSRTIGRGIWPKLDDGPVKDAWRDWSESMECDADGRRTLPSIQRIAMRSIVEAGEVLVQRVTPTALQFRASGVVPLRLKLLEPDHLDDLVDDEFRQGFTGRTVQGVEFDSSGRRKRYHILENHPGDRFGRLENHLLIPADEILHAYREDRTGQVRGIPWGTPCVLTIRDFDDFLDAELLRRKIASAFVGFVHDITAEARDPASTTGELPDPLVEDFEPGTWEELPLGKNITFSDPPQPQGLSEYAMVELRQIAAGFGPSYEELTGDYSQVNFSSGRMGKHAYLAEVKEWQVDIIVRQVMNPTWHWFLDAARLAGVRGVDAAPRYPTWVMPGVEMIDPTKELPMKIAAIRAGITPLSHAILEQGLDPEDTLEQAAKDLEYARSLGLKLDVDPTVSPAPGAGAAPPAVVPDDTEPTAGAKAA